MKEKNRELFFNDNQLYICLIRGHIEENILDDDGEVIKSYIEIFDEATLSEIFNPEYRKGLFNAHEQNLNSDNLQFNLMDKGREQLKKECYKSPKEYLSMNSGKPPDETKNVTFR